MKRIVYILTVLSLGFGATTFAQQPDLKIITDTAKTASATQRQYFVASENLVEVTIKIPQATNIRLVHKIPKGFTDIKTQPLPADCSLITRLSTPALILCLGLDEATQITYTAKLPTTGNGRLTGFTATKSTTPAGEQRWFFERLILTLRSPASSPLPTIRPATPTPTTAPTPTPLPENPADITRHPRTLADPESQIIADASKGVFIASAFFEPQNEAMIIRELTVELTPVDTAALYGDTPDDLDVISRVSLFYQDGTPVTKADGKPAASATVSTAGKVRFTGLDFAIPESGERLFVAVDTATLLNGQSGSAFTAAFSFDAGDADIRGFWSGAQLEGDDIAPDRQESPVQYVLANKLMAALATGQSEVLLSGRNQLLGFDINVSGGDEAYLQAVTAQITKSASGDGFRVTRLRLRQGSDIIASKTGVDLTGDQTLTVGICAAGDDCSVPDGSRQAIFRKTSVFLEAEITPQNGSLTGSNALSASIEINGSTPGQDDILWQDYGNGDDDGVSIRWIDLGSSSVTRLENTLRNP